MNLKSLFGLALVLLLCGGLFAQNPVDYTVQCSAVVQTSPPAIRLHWPADPAATGYIVYRKALNGVGWSAALGNLAGTDTSFVDTNVVVGDAWEYRISKTASGYAGQGYCFAGIERAAQDQLGKLLLVIDTTYAASLAPEIKRLEWDLIGDGWQVVRIEVDRSDSVTGVHDRIQAAWMADPTHVRSVFLLGHVPVPYSGNLNPDGHADHQGAWPADVYYGEMNGTWSDNSTINMGAARQQNQNTIGDGKFDQTSIPSDADLEVGRVDFANMPSFAEGEEALLRRYLEKDHAWRMKQFTAVDSAVVDDNFGGFGGEAFAKSGWRNFAPLVGAEHVVAGDFRTDLSAHDYLWAYGCGGGWYQGASGVGSTTDFATDSLRGVFSMIFGSYHGDWDSDDNFMRAALASRGHMLSCAWAGRPNWYFQHMGLGEPIGRGAKVSQNNSLLYVAGIGARNVHIALMGDPSLRMHVCAPPSNLTITLTNGGNAHELNWTASPDAVMGYAIYRQDTVGERFWRIGTTGLNTTTFTDSCMLSGNYRYMVRAEELRVGYSGSYFNLSQGVIDSISNGSVYSVAVDSMLATVYCAGDTILVPYFTATDFCTGNAFTVQLSDSLGNFAQATVIGIAQATNSGVISCILPANLQPAAGYRLRVDGSVPQVTGMELGPDLEILGPPVANFVASISGIYATLMNQSTPGAQYIWVFSDGSRDTTLSQATFVHTLFQVSGTDSVKLIVVNACGRDSMVEYYIFESSTDPNGSVSLISVSPNPARDWFEVRRLESTAKMEHIVVLDLLGQSLFEQDWDGNQPLRIVTSDWSRGVYVLMVQAKQGILRKRIVLE